MVEMSAEQFAQRVVDYDLLDARQLETIWSELGTRDVTAEEFRNLLVRRELLTNFQVDRLLAGKRTGYYYGDYKVLYLVGAGTFARVYRAVHRNTGKVVAVKVLRQRYSDDAEKMHQFVREAEMVMKLRHPNIVPIYDVISEGTMHYMVMDFIEGQNLRDFLKARQKFSVEESLRLITDVTAGLDYAFQRGITHRDLKLSNVLVSSTGRASIVDFGLAAIESTGSDKPGEQASNPRSIDYAGLERITGVRKDHKQSDIYFAGVMLYQLLTGQAPLHETRDRIQRLSVSRYREVKPITEWDPELPGCVVLIVQKSMELDPSKRFETPGEMLAELKLAAKRIEAGDTAPLGLGQREEVAVAAAKQAMQTKLQMLEGESRSVMIVESNVELQNAFREKLKQYGYRVLVTADPQRALTRFEQDRDLANCVVFSTGELGHSALDAFVSFTNEELTRNIPAILLVNQNQKSLAQQAELGRHHAVVTMPVKFKQFRATLKNLISESLEAA
jgi:serine/threonine protein kinase/CheY-like chemotaxis protein